MLCSLGKRRVVSLPCLHHTSLCHMPDQFGTPSNWQIARHAHNSSLGNWKKGQKLRERSHREIRPRQTHCLQLQFTPGLSVVGAALGGDVVVWRSLPGGIWHCLVASFLFRDQMVRQAAEPMQNPPCSLRNPSLKITEAC
jgi:hypothetical protein